MHSQAFRIHFQGKTHQVLLQKQSKHQQFLLSDNELIFVFYVSNLEDQIILTLIFEKGFQNSHSQIKKNNLKCFTELFYSNEIPVLFRWSFFMSKCSFSMLLLSIISIFLWIQYFFIVSLFWKTCFLGVFPIFTYDNTGNFFYLGNCF